MKMMRRILPCVLVLMVVAMAGCFEGEQPPAASNEKSAPTPARSANTNPNTNTTASALSGQNVNQGRGNENRSNSNRAANSNRGRAATTEAENANRPGAQDANSSAGANANASVQGDDQTPANSNQSQAGSDQATKGPEQTPKGSSSPPQESFLSGIMDYIIYGLAIAGGLLVLVVICMGILHLRNQSRQHLEHQLAKVAAAQASVTREAQKEILDKLSSFSSAQHETNTRLHDVHTEIRSLARLMRDSSPGRGDGRAYSSFGSSYGHIDPSPPPKEEPDFPVSAVDYLGKMTRFANVVKPDFQNGILINDPDGTGELMLIRDSRQPDETQPLFVVPRHAQFSTKQDFYTYYEKYYDCVRPGAGDVWIIDPAVVEKVSGGWQLREKGVLEIR